MCYKVNQTVWANVNREGAVRYSGPATIIETRHGMQPYYLIELPIKVKFLNDIHFYRGPTIDRMVDKLLVYNDEILYVL